MKRRSSRRQKRAPASKAWVYILRCADGAYYTGYTTDLKRRLREHRAGRGSQWIRQRLPVELVFSHRLSRRAAKLVEQRIKGWTRDRKEALIAGEPRAMRWLERTIHKADDD